MKKVYIIHGWGGSPDEKPLQWLEAELIRNGGFEVVRPAMPDPEYPKIEDWVRTLNSQVQPESEIYLVGHSIGCQAILRFLEQTDVKVGRVVLVAPWFDLIEDSYESEEEKEIAKPWIVTPIDFSKIKENCGEVIAIFSDDDYFVEVGSNKKILEENLSAECIIVHNQKHFSEGDGVQTLPKVLEVILR